MSYFAGAVITNPEPLQQMPYQQADARLLKEVGDLEDLDASQFNNRTGIISAIN
jgi:hypothetical protein